MQGVPSSLRDLARVNVAAAELALVMPSVSQPSSPSEEEEAVQHRQDMEVGNASCTSWHGVLCTGDLLHCA